MDRPVLSSTRWRPSPGGTSRRRRRQMLTAPGERRIVGGGEVEAHYPEQDVQESFGLAQREDGRGAAGSGRSRWRDPSTAAAHPAGRSGWPSRQRSLPRTTTPSHRRVERGPGYRPASSQRGTSSYTWDEPSTASLQCGSCGDEKSGPNRPTRRSSCNNPARSCPVLAVAKTLTARDRTVSCGQCGQ